MKNGQENGTDDGADNEPLDARPSARLATKKEPVEHLIAAP